jgi:hypothetical protein
MCWGLSSSLVAQYHILVRNCPVAHEPGVLLCCEYLRNVWSSWKKVCTALQIAVSFPRHLFTVRRIFRFRKQVEWKTCEKFPCFPYCLASITSSSLCRHFVVAFFFTQTFQRAPKNRTGEQRSTILTRMIMKLLTTTTAIRFVFWDLGTFHNFDHKFTCDWSKIWFPTSCVTDNQLVTLDCSKIDGGRLSCLRFVCGLQARFVEIMSSKGRVSHMLDTGPETRTHKLVAFVFLRWLLVPHRGILSQFPIIVLDELSQIMILSGF